MEGEIYRVINIYGKQEFCRNAYSIFYNCDNHYNLEESLFYVDQLKLDDSRIGGNEVFEISNFYWENISEERTIFYKCDEKMNDIELLVYYLKRPLDIFFDDRILNNREVLSKVVKEYPMLLNTLVKGKYRKYISCIGIGTMLIENKVYPSKNVDDNLLDEVFKNSEYYLNYMCNFIIINIDKMYLYYDDYETGLDEGDTECIERILPYLYEIFNDKESFRKVIINLDKKIKEINFYLLIRWFCDDFDLEQEYIDIVDEKKLQLEQRKKELKNEAYKLKYTIGESIKEFELYIDVIVKYKLETSYCTYVYDSDIVDFISQELLENKDFLIVAAKKGYGLSKYSQKFKYDKDIIFEEIKSNAFPMFALDQEMLNNKNDVLKLREIYDKILFYVEPCLLNDYEFMMDYIKSFPIDNFFRLGDKLSKDKKFFYDAIRYDAHILFYCDYELRNNREFMIKMIGKNGYCLRFLGNELKNDKRFLVEMMPRYR